MFRLELYFCEAKERGAKGRGTNVRLQALVGLGLLFLRYPQYMKSERVGTLFRSIFKSEHSPENNKLKRRLLLNIQVAVAATSKAILLTFDLFMMRRST